MFGGKGVEISIELDRPDGVYAVGDTVGAQITLAALDLGRIAAQPALWLGQRRDEVVEPRQVEPRGRHALDDVWLAMAHRPAPLDAASVAQ
jgi:hypothetical protein